jgi:large subunit ribosomal protein L10
MDNPRAEKVAVVDEVRERLGSANASVITEFRGLTVAELAALRVSLAAVGGDYKIFKNTLVRLAVSGNEHEPLTALLSGPTAIAFVHGDLGAVAKALRDFSRTSPSLVMKGGLFEGQLLSVGELTVLADLPSREVLLSRVAGAIAAPLRQFAGLLEALPRNLAYGISALVDQRKALEPQAPPAAPSPEVAPSPDAEEPTGAQSDAAADTEPGAPGGTAEAAPAEAGSASAGAPEPVEADAVAAEVPQSVEPAEPPGAVEPAEPAEDPEASAEEAVAETTPADDGEAPEAQ